MKVYTLDNKVNQKANFIRGSLLNVLVASSNREETSMTVL